jgi:hypothetical protein
MIIEVLSEPFAVRSPVPVPVPIMDRSSHKETALLDDHRSLHHDGSFHDDRSFNNHRPFDNDWRPVNDEWLFLHDSFVNDPFFPDEWRGVFRVGTRSILRRRHLGRRRRRRRVLRSLQVGCKRRHR